MMQFFDISQYHVPPTKNFPKRLISVTLYMYFYNQPSWLLVIILLFYIYVDSLVVYLYLFSKVKKKISK